MKPMKRYAKRYALMAFVSAGSAMTGAALYPAFQPLAAQADPGVTQPATVTPAQASQLPGGDVNIFSSLAKKTVPSVVNISTVTLAKTPSRRYQSPEDMFREFFGPGFHGFQGGMRSQRELQPAPRSASLGTGFVIDPSGIILTNNHVVDGADEIKITFTENQDEKPTPGKVIGRDPDLDIALIQVKTDRKLTALPLGDSEKLEVGEYVAAVGNPFGQGHSFTHGIVSAKGRIAPQMPLASYLQTDAPINPGNSGGPLINLRGEVIGINNAIDARAQNIGFAIPINAVKPILSELRSNGEIKRGYIGVAVGELRPELAQKINVPKEVQGSLVMEVSPGGPAYLAGIRPYDVITEFNGKPVHSPAELTAQVTALPEGKSVPVKITRADQSLKLNVKLAKRPSPQES